MKDSLNHALVITTLLERDIARICASGNEAQQGLAADCAEHRRQLANKLRHIETLSRIIPSTPEQSAELHKLAERSREINATQSRMSELIAQTNSEESRDRYEASAKAGDFTPVDWSAEEMTGFAEINEVSDKAYHADLIRKENVEMWRSYDRRKNWLGCGLACIAAGAILAGIKIWFTYFQQ